MLLLAIDTSTTAITVAVHDRRSVLGEQTVLDARGHAEQLAPALVRLFDATGVRPAQLTRIAVGAGPGPFSGLRVGLVTAVTLGYALGLDVGGVSSLDALAYAAYASHPGLDDLAVATDARRKEVYWATYRRGCDAVPRRLAGPSVNRASDIAAAPGGDRVGGRPVVGRGGLLYPDAFGPHGGELDVSAAALAALAVRLLARDGALPDPTPQYLRRPDARPLPVPAGRSS